MKLALLVEIPLENVLEFEQEFEELCNKHSAKFIYRLKSKNPIRLVPGEKPMTHHAYTPPGADQGVNHAGFIRHRGLDWSRSSLRRSPGGSRGSLPHDYPAGEFVQECDGWKHHGGSPSDFAADSNRRSRLDAVRFRVGASQAQRPQEARRLLEKQAFPLLRPQVNGKANLISFPQLQKETESMN